MVYSMLDIFTEVVCTRVNLRVTTLAIHNTHVMTRDMSPPYLTPWRYPAWSILINQHQFIHRLKFSYLKDQELLQWFLVASGILLYLKLAILNRIHLATPNITTKYRNTIHSYYTLLILHSFLWILAKKKYMNS